MLVIDWLDIALHTALVAAGPVLVGTSVYIVAREIAQNGWPLGAKSAAEAVWPLAVCWPVYGFLLWRFWP